MLGSLVHVSIVLTLRAFRLSSFGKFKLALRLYRIHFAVKPFNNVHDLTLIKFDALIYYSLIVFYMIEVKNLCFLVDEFVKNALIFDQIQKITFEHGFEKALLDKLADTISITH